MCRTDDLQESRGIIAVEEFDAGTMHRFLSFLYDKQYLEILNAQDTGLEEVTSRVNRRLIINIRMLAVAEYYQVTELHAHALARFQNRLNHDSFDEDDFEMVVKEAYTRIASSDCPSKLRLCDLAGSKWFTLTEDDDNFIPTMAALPGFSTHMLNSLTNAYRISFDLEESRHRNELIAKNADWRKQITNKEIQISRLNRQLGSETYTVAELQKLNDDLTAKMATMTEELDALTVEVQGLKASRPRPLYRVLELERDTGTPDEGKKQFRLRKLYTGCCNDNAKWARAHKGSDGWYFECRLCEKKHSVSGRNASKMTVTQ